MARKRGTLRGLQAEFDPMRESVEVVELLLAGRDEEAAQHFERAERAAKAAAERQIPRITIWTGEPDRED